MGRITCGDVCWQFVLSRTNSRGISYWWEWSSTSTNLDKWGMFSTLLELSIKHSPTTLLLKKILKQWGISSWYWESPSLNHSYTILGSYFEALGYGLLEEQLVEIFVELFCCPDLFNSIGTSYWWDRSSSCNKATLEEEAEMNCLFKV